MNCRITYYNEKVEKETFGFPKGIIANFLHIIEMIEAFGVSLGQPYLSPIGKGAF